MSKMIIPWDTLSKEALLGVIEDFVTRDGTDYGEREITLDARVARVRAQLEAGTAVIVFDSARESASIVTPQSLDGPANQD